MARLLPPAGTRAKTIAAVLAYGLCGLLWLRGADWLMEAQDIRWLERYADLAFIAVTAAILYLIVTRGHAADPWRIITVRSTGTSPRTGER